MPALTMIIDIEVGDETIEQVRAGVTAYLETQHVAKDHVKVRVLTSAQPLAKEKTMIVFSKRTNPMLQVLHNWLMGPAGDRMQLTGPEIWNGIYDQAGAPRPSSYDYRQLAGWMSELRWTARKEERGLVFSRPHTLGCLDPWELIDMVEHCIARRARAAEEAGDPTLRNFAFSADNHHVLRQILVPGAECSVLEYVLRKHPGLVIESDASTVYETVTVAVQDA